MNQDLSQYTLRLADTALTLGQRLAEWCGHGPYLEEDVALTNVSLDLIGHAQMFYQMAAATQESNSTPDDLAFLRDAHEYRNPLITELPRGDFAFTTLRQYFLDVFNRCLYQAMANSSNNELAAVAKKAGMEVKYHLARSQAWCERLSLSTAEAKSRMQQALDDLWFYTPELFETDVAIDRLIEAGVAPDYQAIQQQWQGQVEPMLDLCGLTRPADGWVSTGGLQGEHTEHLGFMLAEMQFLPRAYPGCEW